MIPILIILIMYTLIAWAVYMFVLIANEKAGTEWSRAHGLFAFLVGALWPVTILGLVGMALHVKRKLRKAGHVSKNANSAHRSPGNDQE